MLSDGSLEICGRCDSMVKIRGYSIETQVSLQESFFSSPEPKVHWWVYGIGRSSSSIVCHPHSVNIFFSETAWPISQISYGASMGWRNGGTKVCSNGPGHMSKMTSMQTLKNLLLRNQKADDLEIGMQYQVRRVLPSLFKWWPWGDLDLFYDKVKFGPLCFCMGKR